MICNFFSIQLVVCLFILLMGSFALQKLFGLMRAHSFIFAFGVLAFDVRSKKSSRRLMSRSLPLMLSSRKNALSASIKMTVWFFSSFIILIDLQILNHSCISEILIYPTWSCCMILLKYCWIQVANILLIFVSVFSGILACNFVSLWHPWLVLVSG